MSEIRQLSANMVNKIAAGEVVERPASVVKELVENSIDAGAKRIEVVVERSGFDLIRIQDDGRGIPSDQVRLALLPHATSKISEADDLFNITTFGFRGEALASIAEISQFVLRSRVAESPEGTEIRSDGGIVAGTKPCGTPPGTVIDVRNIFFNIPARRKYLKSASTEFGHISETFMRLAIPQTGVHFILKHNDKIVQEFPPVSSFFERVSSLVGKAVAQKLLKVECRRGDVHISGFVGHPDVSRSNAGFQYFFLNRRFIKDRSLQHALTEAYRGLLTVGRYPVAFLEIEVPPNFVDVNVHPTKQEVRFLDSHSIYSGFLSGIREQLLLTDLSSRPDADDIDGVRSGKGISSREKKELAAFADENNFDPRSALDSDFVEETRRNVLRWSSGETRSDFDGLNFLKDDPDSEYSDPLQDRGTFGSLDSTKNGDSAEASLYKRPCLDRSSSNSAGETSNNGGRARSSGGLFGSGTGRERSNESLNRSAVASFLGKRVPDFVPFPNGNRPSFGSNDSAVVDKNAVATDGSELRFGDEFSNNASKNENVKDDDCPNGESRNGGTPNDGDESLSKTITTEAARTIHPNVALSPSGEPVLQIHQRYLVKESAEGLAIIDQHALHERILYEKIKANLNRGRLDSQSLLVPEAVDLSPSEAACALENKDFLAEFGLIVDSFGGNTVVVNGYPAILERVSPSEILSVLVDAILKGSKKPDRSELLEEMICQTACKAAVKAGDLLRSDSITELLDLAEQEINAHHCPHGRPSTLVISCKDIDKLFKRT